VARYKKTTRVPRPHRQDLRQAQEAGVVTEQWSSHLQQYLPNTTQQGLALWIDCVKLVARGRGLDRK
jgi:hypothetical protein